MRSKLAKKFIVLIACLSIFSVFASNSVHTADAEGASYVALGAAQSGNGVGLTWTPEGNNYYRILRANDKDGYSKFTPVAFNTQNGVMPMKNEVIDVLPIVPTRGAANFLKIWLSGVENLNINIMNPVSFEDFNENTDDGQNKYLYKSHGASADVDIIFFGAADSNGQKDLSEKARQSVRYFIEKNNGGVIFAHDTIALGESPAKYNNNWSKFWEMCKEIKLIDSYDGYYKNNDVYNNNQNNKSNESNRIKMTKTGLLTSYPYIIGLEPGEVFEVGLSHNVGQAVFNNNDKWFEFYGSKKPSDTEESNFFLTTHGKTAMIQTGHSSTVTTKEMMIIANLIYYIGSNQSTDSFYDREATDITSPTVAAESVSVASGNMVLKITTDDVGTKYTYLINEYKRDADMSKAANRSGYQNCEVKSGLKECYYLIDGNENVNPENSKFQKLTLKNSSKGFVSEVNCIIKNMDQYLHIKSIDNAGNKTTQTYRILGDSSSPIIKIGDGIKDENSPAIHEEDLSELEVHDVQTDGETMSDVKGYALSEANKCPSDKEFVKDKNRLDLKKYGSGYKWLWVKDYAGNTSKTKIYIHSDLIFKDKNGNRVEINSVEFNGVEMDEYYFGDKKIFH